MQTYIPVPTVKLTVTNPTAQSVLNGLQTPLNPTAVKLYTLLFDAALRVSQHQQHPVTPSQQVIHQPVEVIAVALGLSRVTVYKHLAILGKLGLVAHRGHVGAWFGLSRKTGTLFAVCLRPGAAAARLTYSDLKHAHRDLQADTQSDGIRTAWRFLQSQAQTLQSQPESQKAAKSALRAWALKPGHTQNPDTELTVNPGDSDVREVIYSLETLSSTHKTKQAALVDSFAHALSRGFLDSDNLNFWRKLLWDALKRDWEGLNTLSRLENALIRLVADVQEWEGLRKPGALLVSRLKTCGLWDDLRYS